jgi:hypothetical protein
MDVFYHLVLGFNHSGFQSYRSIQSFVIQNLTGIQLAVLYLLNNEISRLSCGPYGYTFTTSEPTHPMLHVHVLDGWNAFCPITAVVMVYCHAFRTHSLYCSLLNTHFPFRMAVVSASQEFHTSWHDSLSYAKMKLALCSKVSHPYPKVCSDLCVEIDSFNNIHSWVQCENDLPRQAGK